jgi:hypothetical protein
MLPLLFLLVGLLDCKAGIGTAEFAEAYAAASLAAVSEVAGVPETNIVDYLKALPAEVSSSARKLKQEAQASSSGVSAVYELYSNRPAETADAVSKAVANNGEMLNRALAARNVPYYPAVLLNGDRIVQAQIPSAEADKAAAMPVTPMLVSVPVSKASAASSAKQNQHMEWWKQAAIGIGAAAGAILIISAAAVAAVLYKKQQIQRSAVKHEWDNVSLTQQPDAAAVEQSYLSTDGYVTSEAPGRFGSLIQEISKRVDSIKSNSDSSYNVFKQPYTRSFVECLSSTQSLPAASCAKATEVKDPHAPVSKPVADPMEKGGQDIEAGDISSGVVASFRTAFNNWKRAADCSGRGGVKTLTMDEYDADSVSSEESCTPTSSQHSNDRWVDDAEVAGLELLAILQEACATAIDDQSHAAAMFDVGERCCNSPV